MLKSVKIIEVVNALEKFAPLPLQEDYDNAGLQVGLTETEVSGALLCLDVTEDIVEEAMRQGCTYTVTIPQGIGADQETLSICYDIWNAQSEAVHVNIIGYTPAEQSHAADLYQWLGDGGQRDYS